MNVAGGAERMPGDRDRRKKLMRVARYHRSFLLILLMAVPVRSGAKAGEAVRFGVCLSLSGSMSESGNAYYAGVKIRMDEHNAQAGPNDFLLEAVVRDDASDAQTAAAIVDELAAVEKVRAIVGPTSSALTAAMRPNAARHQVIVVSPSATRPDIGKNEDWVFTVLFDDSFQGAVLGKYVAGRLGAKRLAVVANRASAYGKLFWDSFRDAAMDNGAVIVAEEWYDWDVKRDPDHDFSTNLANIKLAEPDMTLLPNYSWEVAAIIRQSLAADLETVFCGGDTWLNDTVMLESGYHLEGGYFVASRDINSAAPEMRHYARLYDNSNEAYARSNSYQGYDALSLVIEALKNAKDGESLREGLFRIKDYPLATGPTTIDRVKGTVKPGCIYRMEMIDDVFTPVFIDEVLP